MLRIIDANNLVPEYHLVDPNKKIQFQPGQIGQFKRLKDKYCCTLSDGIAPIGVIDDIRFKLKAGFTDTTATTHQICIWRKPGFIAQTNQFEWPKQAYFKDQPLSVNQFGFLTSENEKSFNVFPDVALVIDFDSFNKILTFKWLRKSI